MIKAYLCFYLDAEDSFEDDLNHYVTVKLFTLKSSQYVFRTPYRTWGSDWERILYDGTYMTDDEFLSNFRMDRECIQQLNRMVEHDEVFSQCWGKRSKILLMLHIMVFLKYLGSYGNEASLQRIGRAVGISKGALNECVMQASGAILKLQKQAIRWPDDEEQKRISGRISKARGFLHCVGLIDGMLFPLAFAPMLSGEDYFTRKGNYAVKGLIICDDTAKITWVEMGWPGSVHDNRVWLNSDVYPSTTRNTYLVIWQSLHSQFWSAHLKGQQFQPERQSRLI